MRICSKVVLMIWLVKTQQAAVVNQTNPELHHGT
jgi:hypothetical protein